MLTTGWRGGVAVLLIGLCVGCAKNYPGDRRFPLSGMVRVEGVPIDAGTISFLPADAKTQRVSGGTITDGVYKVEEAMGANAGEYRVEIHWYKKTGRKVRDPATDDLIDERKEGLAKKYHAESELKVWIGPGQTQFDFDLSSQ